MKIQCTSNAKSTMNKYHKYIFDTIDLPFHVYKLEKGKGHGRVNRTRAFKLEQNCIASTVVTKYPKCSHPMLPAHKL